MHNAADRHPAANALNQVPLTCPGRPVFYAIAISLCSFVQSAYATCYSVYKENVLIFQSIIAPVDMSMFLSETISAKYGAGAEMVFSDGINQCAGIDTSRIIQLEKTRSGQLQRQYAGTQRPSARSTAGSPKANVLLPQVNNGELVANLSGYQGSFDGNSALEYQGSMQTGPRGGQYYINSGGNKTYVGGGGSGWPARR